MTSEQTSPSPVQGPRFNLNSGWADFSWNKLNGIDTSKDIKGDRRKSVKSKQIRQFFIYEHLSHKGQSHSFKLSIATVGAVFLP